MCFNVRNVVCAHAGKIQRLGNDFRLAFDAGREVAHFARAIIIDGRSKDHGTDMVPVFERVFKPPQHDNSKPAAKDRPAGGGIEGPAVTVARKNLTVAIEIALAVREFRW